VNLAVETIRFVMGNHDFSHKILPIQINTIQINTIPINTVPINTTLATVFEFRRG
jgi:hypothetical protein